MQVALEVRDTLVVYGDLESQCGASNSTLVMLSWRARGRARVVLPEPVEPTTAMRLVLVYSPSSLIEVSGDAGPSSL